MTRWLQRISIRTRLLLVYSLILLMGFGALAFVAGQQIATSARLDYTQRLRNEITLIAQGVAGDITSYARGETSQDDLNAAFAPYEDQVHGVLSLVAVPGHQGDGPRDSFRDQLEIETALRGQVVVVERPNDAGESTFYTAVPVGRGDDIAAILHLSVPAANLQTVIAERWLVIAIIFILIAVAAIAAAFLLARSIIRPLSLVRDAARRLSAGDLTSRAAYTGKDEIGEVAGAFNDMAGRVEAMIEEQRAFASNASHELRTPLTSIRLRTEALRDDATLEPDVARKYIAEIDDEAARLTDLVQDLTLLSRLDAGRAEPGHDHVDMARFATSLVRQMNPVAQDRGVSLILAPLTASLTVDAGLSHLTVVFRNLLDNAIKYTPKGGDVLWAVEADGAHVRHTIRDTGRGIDAEHLAHVFERFYRGDKAHSRETYGTGLGLALVKSIVEFYGGRITVESPGVDQGTVVVVRWPVTPPASPQSAQRMA